MTRLTVYIPATADTFGILPGSGIVGSVDDMPCPHCHGQWRQPSASNIVTPTHCVVCSGCLRTFHVTEGRNARIRLDFEPGKFRQMGFDRFETRLMHAADRHTWNNGRGYPTMARRWVKPCQVRAVATYDTDTRQVVDVVDAIALATWVARYGELIHA